MGQTSSLSEMFEGVLTFVRSINQESSHHAFVEQFTTVSTKHDYLPGMKDITAVCTGYAIRLLQNCSRHWYVTSSCPKVQVPQVLFLTY